MEEVYARGLRCQDWNVVRRCAGALGMVHPQLEDALTDLLMRQTQVVVGRNYTVDSRLGRPLDSGAIAERIARTSGSDSRERMLEQELLLALDSIARREPTLLKGSLTLQLSQLLLLLTSELASEQRLSQDEAFEALCGESPHLIRDRLRLLSDVEHGRAALQRGEQLHVSGRVQWCPTRWSWPPAVATGSSIGSAWAPCRRCPGISTPESGACCATAVAW